MFSQHAHWGLSPHLLAWFCDYWDNNMVAAMCVCVCACFAHVQSETLSTQGHYRNEAYTLWCLPDRNQIPWILLLTAHSATALAVFLVPPALGITAATGSPQGGAFVYVCVFVAMSSSKLILQHTGRAFVTQTRAVKTSQQLRLLNRLTKIPIKCFYLSKLAWC